MAKQTLAQRSEEYVTIANENGVDINGITPSWGSHKDADEAFASLQEAITLIQAGTSVAPSKTAKTNSKENDNMAKVKAPKDMSKTELMEAYEELRTNNEELEEAYPELPKSITKAAALKALKELTKANEDIDEEEDAGDDDEGVSAGSDNAGDSDADEGSEESQKVYVTEKQYAFLSLFTKKAILVKNLQAKMEEESEGSGKAVHILISGLEKKGLLTTELNKKDEKTVALTDAGAEIKKAKFEPAPEKPKAKGKKKAKAPFVPPYSEEEIAGAKKKKAAKMIAANEEALELYNSKPSRSAGTRTPSTYNGKVEVGKWQKENDTSEKWACRDEWEKVVTKKFLMTRMQFCHHCVDNYDMKISTPGGQWSQMYTHYGFTMEDVAEIQAKSGVATTKAAKKGKKSKKEEAPETPEVNEGNEEELTKEEKKALKKAKKAAKKAKKK